MRLFAVRAAEGGTVTVVPARTKLAARMRVSEERLVPLSRLDASEEPETQAGSPWRGDIKRFRCGQVGLTVVWSTRAREYFVEATYEGERRYVSVAGKGPSFGLEEARRAARSVVQTLLNADDLDERLVVYAQEDERRPPVIHMIEERLGE